MICVGDVAGGLKGLIKELEHIFTISQKDNRDGRVVLFELLDQLQGLTCRYYFRTDVSAVTVNSTLCYDRRVKFSIWCKDHYTVGAMSKLRAAITAEYNGLNIIIAVTGGNILIGRRIGFFNRRVAHGKQPEFISHLEKHATM